MAMSRRYREVYYVLSPAPLLEMPPEVRLLGYSIAVGHSWLTIVSVPHRDRNTHHRFYTGYSLMELFAHEGAYAAQMITIAEL